MDTIIGLGVGVGVICTLGKHKPIFKIVLNHLSSSNKLLVRPYTNLLKTINPEAKFSGDHAKPSYSEMFIIRYCNYTPPKPPMISGEGDGFLSDLVINKLKDISRGYYNSDNFLKRYVFSRLTYVLLAVACLVTRAVDGIIGIPAAGLSILTGGKFESLNNLAYRTLQATGIINDLFYCTIKFINPRAGTAIA